MKHYFEVTYPKRLIELKEQLESFAVKVSILAQSDSTKEECIYEIENFRRTLFLFVTNTQLHVPSLVPDVQYLNRVSKEYLLNYLDPSTAAGNLFMILHMKQEKEKNDGNKRII